MEIKYCGSSTVTNNKHKHSQNVTATIFSSGCCIPYIHTIIATPLHFLRLPLSLIFCFIVGVGPSTQSSIEESWSAVARDIDYACKCLVREIKVIMCVRVRLCRNACVSRRMRESWQLCTSPGPPNF